MTLPSGIWGFVNPVPQEEIEEAKNALDRALLAQVGLPEDLDIRALENGLFDLVEDIREIFDDGFKPSLLVSSLPELIANAEGLWTAVADKLDGKVERKEFIGRVIKYAYRKVDPDLPKISGLAEVLAEDLILGAIPDLVDNLDNMAESLIDKIKNLFR